MASFLILRKQDDGVYDYHNHNKVWKMSAKYPAEIGDTFVNNLGDTVTVTSLDKEVKLQIGSFKAVEYTCEQSYGNNVSRDIDYYVPGIGRVLHKSVILEGNGKRAFIRAGRTY